MKCQTRSVLSFFLSLYACVVRRLLVRPRADEHARESHTNFTAGDLYCDIPSAPYLTQRLRRGHVYYEMRCHQLLRASESTTALIICLYPCDFLLDSEKKCVGGGRSRMTIGLSHSTTSLSSPRSNPESHEESLSPQRIHLQPLPVAV